MHERTLGRFVAQTRGSARGPSFEPQFAELEQRVRGRYERRAVELGRLREGDGERARLRQALSESVAGELRPEWVVLHAAYDFSGDGATWGPVVGDYSNSVYGVRSPKPEGDLPGYYGRVLNALSASVKCGEPLPGLEPHTLDDPAFGLSFASGAFESQASVAGSFGIYELSLMTGYDNRPRDGQPSDGSSILAWRDLRRQAVAGTELVGRAADSSDLSLPRVFKAFATSKYPRFAAGESRGDYVGLQVTGTLSEDRPAAGALIAVWPGSMACRPERPGIHVGAPTAARTTTRAARGSGRARPLS